MRRVHREATKCIVFIGSQPAWTEQQKRGLAYCIMEETAFYSINYGRNGILFIKRGLEYRKTELMDLCWSTTVETGVLFIGRGLAYHETGLHGLLFTHRRLPS